MDAEPAVATALFADRLAEAVERKRSQLVVGLDPRPELLPVELAATRTLSPRPRPMRAPASAAGSSTRSRRYAVAVKPQLAFFEALGSDGRARLRGRLRLRARRPGCS